MLSGSEVLINLLPLTDGDERHPNCNVRENAARRIPDPGRTRRASVERICWLHSTAGNSPELSRCFPDRAAAQDHPFWYHPAIIVTPHDACDVSMDAIKATLATTADALGTGRQIPTPSTEGVATRFPEYSEESRQKDAGYWPNASGLLTSISMNAIGCDEPFMTSCSTPDCRMYD